MSREDKQQVVCLGMRGRPSDNVELSRDIQSSLSHPAPRSAPTVRHLILWTLPSPHNCQFKHSIIAIVSRSSLSIFLMASQRDGNSEPTFHNKRQVT